MLILLAAARLSFAGETPIQDQRPSAILSVVPNQNGGSAFSDGVFLELTIDDPGATPISRVSVYMMVSYYMRATSDGEDRSRAVLWEQIDNSEISEGSKLLYRFPKLLFWPGTYSVWFDLELPGKEPLVSNAVDFVVDDVESIDRMAKSLVDLLKTHERDYRMERGLGYASEPTAYASSVGKTWFLYTNLYRMSFIDPKRMIQVLHSGLASINEEDNIASDLAKSTMLMVLWNLSNPEYADHNKHELVRIPPGELIKLMETERSPKGMDHYYSVARLYEELFDEEEFASLRAMLETAKRHRDKNVLFSGYGALIQIKRIPMDIAATRKEIDDNKFLEETMKYTLNELLDRRVADPAPGDRNVWTRPSPGSIKITPTTPPKKQRRDNF